MAILSLEKEASFCERLAVELRLDSRRISLAIRESPEMAGPHLWVDVAPPDRYHMGMTCCQQLPERFDKSGLNDALGICVASLVELRKKNGYHDELIEE